MSEPKAPESRPEPPEPKTSEPSVYGDQWGGSGKQGDQPGQGKVDRPEPIEDGQSEPGAGEEGGRAGA